MAKLNTPKGKLVRKLGVNIFGNPKFDRLLSKKGHRPGQHGKMGKRPSTYALQLQEKQKIYLFQISVFCQLYLIQKK